MQLTTEIETLQNQIRDMQIQELKDKQYKGTLYELYMKGADNPFYVGITDQKAKTDDQNEQIRLQGHIRQCLDIMKTSGCDYAHLFILGQLVTYAQTNGISKHDLKPSDFLDLIQSKPIKTDIQDREELERLEGE